MVMVMVMMMIVIIVKRGYSARRLLWSPARVRSRTSAPATPLAKYCEKAVRRRCRRIQRLNDSPGTGCSRAQMRRSGGGNAWKF